MVPLVLIRPQRFRLSSLWFILYGALITSGCIPNTEQITFPTSTEIPTSTPTQTITNTLRSSFTPSLTPTITPSLTLEPSPTNSLVPRVYVFPVQPKNNYVSYLEGVSAHGYPAIDIFAPVGWKYVAVTDGVVEFVSFKDSWDPAVDDPGNRGGIALSIIGDDGFRYYGSHLSKIEKNITPGVRVSAGQVIGYIGESGNARGRGSHLHFGISRPTYPEDWKTRRGEINPFPYLNFWAEGSNIIPIYSTPTPKPTP